MALQRPSKNSRDCISSIYLLVIFVSSVLNMPMHLAELFTLTEHIREGARSFGIWLGRLYYETHDKVAGIHLYDYKDDPKGNALRYRLLADHSFRQYLLTEAMPQINAKGWHLTVDTKLSRNRWQMVFEPTLTSQVPRATIFWHVTAAANVPSILQHGLLPRESRHGFKFPQKRIYLVRQRSDAAHMMQVLAQRDREPVKYDLLRVDLRRTKGITLHIDPELPDDIAAYATQPIPPASISVED